MEQLQWATLALAENDQKQQAEELYSMRRLVALDVCHLQHARLGILREALPMAI